MTTAKFVGFLALFFVLFAGFVAVLTPDQVEPFVPERTLAVELDELLQLNPAR